MNVFRNLSFSLCRFSNITLRPSNCIKCYPLGKVYPRCQIRLMHTTRHLLGENNENASQSQNKDFQVLVYEGLLRKRIKVVKILCLSTTMIGASIFPSVIYDLAQSNILMAYICSLTSMAFLSTPFLLHYITKSYVIELHFNPQTKTFTAKTYNAISQIKEIEFQASDVTVPDVPGIFYSIIVKGTPLFVDYRLVNDADAYGHMMGYDKPFDFKTYEQKSEKVS